MQFSTNFLADLILHCFVYFPSGNDANLFDLSYQQNYDCFCKEKKASKLIQWMQKEKELYDKNPDYYVTVQFFPFLHPTWSAFEEAVYHTYGKEDPFINNLMQVAQLEEKSYALFWQSQQSANKLINQHLSADIYHKLKPLECFQSIISNMDVICLVSLTRAGRMLKLKNRYLVGVGHQLSLEELFFQLVHECAHTISDPLIPGEILFADNTHDEAEGGSFLLGYRLLEKIEPTLLKAYCEFFDLPTSQKEIIEAYQIKEEVMQALINITA